MERKVNFARLNKRFMSFILKEKTKRKNQNLIKIIKNGSKKIAATSYFIIKPICKKTLTRKKLWRGARLPSFRGAGSRELFVKVSRCFRVILADELDLLTTKTKVFSLRRFEDHW